MEQSESESDIDGEIEIVIGPPDCDACKRHDDHLCRAHISRQMYKEDVQRNNDPSDAFYSMDMQNIIMLPHFPDIKTALFTKRILLISQTIAPLGGKGTKNKKPFAFLWHEGIQGRNDEDRESAVVKFLNLDTLCQNLTLWCDNCSGQNKNRTLFGALAYYLNKPSVSLHSTTQVFWKRTYFHERR